ncbi:UNVERIFIED_CONTAM: hypothetical protein FKN15_018427 [Acipenser sinensis]
MESSVVGMGRGSQLSRRLPVPVPVLHCWERKARPGSLAVGDTVLVAAEAGLWSRCAPSESGLNQIPWSSPSRGAHRSTLMNTGLKDYMQ